MKITNLISVLILLAISCVDVDNGVYNGIDVSHHQGKIEWKKVAKDENIEFVYIKATEGATYCDNMYKTNIQEARKNNLKCGSYHYFRMSSSVEAQFNNFISNVKKDEQDLIPMIDVEINKKDSKGYNLDGYYVSNTKDTKAITDSLAKFLNKVTEYYGAEPMIYCTLHSYNTLIKDKFSKYRIYLGHYKAKEPGYSGCTIWQYSENGYVIGIEKKVDLCAFQKNYGIKDIEYKR